MGSTLHSDSRKDEAELSMGEDFKGRG